jgi:type VI secretion system protein ImpJ
VIAGEDVVEARPLEGAFPAALEALDVFLALPIVRDTAANVALDPAKAGPAQRLRRDP